MIKHILAVAMLLSPITTKAIEPPILARITVYWAKGRGSDHFTRRHRTSTGIRLQEGHCAVDPIRIPYGSKILMHDAELLAVDTGSAVRTRRAARRSGRTSLERAALVIDRFFETKTAALSWERRNPRFAYIKITRPGPRTVPVYPGRRAATVKQKVLVTPLNQHNRRNQLGGR